MRLRFLSLLLLLVPLSAFAQYDVSASYYGQFTTKTTSSSESAAPDNSGGLLLGVRHYIAPWKGYEFTYGFNPVNYTFNGSTPRQVKAQTNTFTGDYVVHLPVPLAGIRPFALAGIGFNVFNPQTSAGSPGSSTSFRPLFCWGAGLDYRLLPLVGMRLQYRALIYESPTFGQPVSTGSATTTSEPSIGLYLHF